MPMSPDDQWVPELTLGPPCPTCLFHLPRSQINGGTLQSFRVTAFESRARAENSAGSRIWSPTLGGCMSLLGRREQYKGGASGLSVLRTEA